MATKDAIYHRSLTFSNGRDLVFGHYMHTDNIYGTQVSKKTPYSKIPDADFNSYKTNFEANYNFPPVVTLAGRASPENGAYSLFLRVGYYGWAQAANIWIPEHAKRDSFQERGYKADRNLKLEHILSNVYWDRGQSPHALNGPYKVYYAFHGPPAAGYVRVGASEEKYRILLDIEGRLIAATDYDNGGVLSKTSMQILISVVGAVLVNRYVRNPIIKSLVSNLWTRA